LNDIRWIDEALSSARPKAVAALLRYFRNLDTAEEAFQEACLRALQRWPDEGPPRDPAAWLIFVGRNYVLDHVRRDSKQQALPDDDLLPHARSTEAEYVEQVETAHYRDDILKLLFICCHPDLPANQQIALALRVVSGLSVKEIARAFLVTETAMEQRITRAKRKVAAAKVEFETPTLEERAERLGTVCAMIYLVFNEGYSASGGDSHVRVPLCDEAIRLARLLAGLFPDAPEVLGLIALLLLQHARTPARLNEHGDIVLLEDQNRALWNGAMIAEGLTYLDQALGQAEVGPYQLQAAIASLHSGAARPEDTRWAEIERLYAALEAMQPSPVIALNRAVAVSKVQGPDVALAMVDELAPKLHSYFYFHGVRGALLMQLLRNDDARESFNRAIALANSAAEAAHIRAQLDRLAARQT
jgi:RNA polymerase sigma-70 factor (ECF subfamily)